MRAAQLYEKNYNYRGVFRDILQFGRAYSSLSQQLLFYLVNSFFI